MRCDIFFLLLGIAACAEEPREEAPAAAPERDVVDFRLDRDGKLLYRGRNVTNDELATILDKSRRLLALKHRQEPRTCGNGVPEPRLDVEVRASLAVSADRIREVAGIIAAARPKEVRFVLDGGGE